MTSRPLQILLVEDSPSDVELVRLGLAGSHLQHELHHTEDGVEALSFLRNEGAHKDKPRPDLILLDINLPRKDGHEVLAEIKGDPDLLSIPVVVFTTSEQSRDIVKAYTQHVNAYITKPADASEFLAAIRGIEKFWLTMAKLPTLGRWSKC